MSKDNEEINKSLITDEKLSAIERYKLEQELRNLRNRNDEMIKTIKILDSDKKLLKSEAESLEKELKRLKTEIVRLNKLKLRIESKNEEVEVQEPWYNYLQFLKEISTKIVEGVDDEVSKNFIKSLEKKLRDLETEYQLLDAERIRLEQELHSLRNEIDRLREPPLATGVIVKVLDKAIGRIIIQTTLGQLFVVNCARKIDKEKLSAGLFVALNQRNWAVMDFLDITDEEIREVRKNTW